MLNHEALIDLYRKLREEKVLSVYIDGRASEFSERGLWKKRLEHGVADARRRMQETTPEDEKDLEKALELIQKELGQYDQFLPDRGWVGFATADTLHYAEAVRVPMPDLVCWEPGVRVAPYVRALKQDRPVITVLSDRRRARIFRYAQGELSEPMNIIAEDVSGDLSDINTSKRASSYSGIRGQTGTDAAQKVLAVEADRLRKHLADTVAEEAGDGGFVVLGGTSEWATALRDQLPRGLASRTLQEAGAHLEMSTAEVRKVSEDAASRLTQSAQERLLEEVVNQAHSGGKGALGTEEVERALRESRVETLLLTRGFIRANPDYADHLVGAAFQQHADVEELSFDGAQRLDREGDGVAARLRFRAPAMDGAAPL